ncbi:multidrug transporter MatE [Methanobrevibacter sp. YE315]|uniref:MATE family efflux transporter n=1 Tax=Methanobrevibacter sp. YE315 TaxID=1609968 RepID=UPI000764E4BE|nr:MATE family efflux transporter [Methanobrevibacter sp. YE315]AMD17312.1 multidrug transporter MatE [Methanobrevibacter sp. YE315]
MANKNMEILTGDPKTSLLKLSFPIMVTLLVTTLYNVVDGIWVVGLGVNAVAGIGLVTPLWMIINGVATGLANGITSSITRFRGEYGGEKPDEVAGQSVVILLVVSIILTIGLLLALGPFINLYSPSSKATEEAFAYSIPLFLGLFGFVFSCGFSGILRAEGDTKRAMYATTLGIILNALFDPIFIYVFNWGSAGASISTIVTSLISAVIMYYWIFVRKDTYINIDVKRILKSKWDWSISKDILSTGIPASAVLFMLSFAAMIFYYLIGMISGDLGIAIFSSAYRIYLLGLSPISAFCSALVAIIGTHYGAGNIKDVKRAHTYCTLYSFILGAVICALFIVFKNQLAYVFLLTINNPNLFEGIVEFIAITSFCIPFLGIGMPSSFLYQGLGKGIISFAWTLIYEIIFTVPATIFFAFVLNYGLTGIWLGFVAGRSAAAVLNYIGARYSIKKLSR